MSELLIKNGDAVTKYLGTTGTGVTGDPYFSIPADFQTEVVKGNVYKHTIMTAMGERASMGTTTRGEDLWRGNELTPAPTSHTSIPLPDSAGEQMSVVSEDPVDTNGGVGVRSIRIHYLDATGDEQTEDVTMNGTIVVNTIATNIRFVNDMHTLTTGSGGVASGHIKIHKTGTSGLVYNMIAQGGNQSLIPNRMIPNNKTLILKGWHVEEAADKQVNFRIRSTDKYGVLIQGIFCFKGVSYLKKTTSGDLIMNEKIPEFSVVKVSAWPAVAGAEGACGWWGILVDD